MALRKGREPSAAIEALSWISQFDPKSSDGTTLQDLQRQQAIVATLKRGMDESLSNKARLHGWRVQNLFEAVVVALGSTLLVKAEDTGNYYFDDSKGPIKPPDFRIVQQDGQQVLVEVKNVPPFHLDWSIRDQDVQQARRYAELTSGRLLYGHYWSAANMWTLVDSEALERRDSRWALTISAAAKANQFSKLGDKVIGTRPPLRLSLLPDPAKPQKSLKVDDGRMELRFTIGSTELSCAGRVLTTRVERKIAWFLMMYGKWEMERSVELDEGDQIKRVDFTYSPEIPDEETERQLARQEFAIVDSLSSMYSTMFNAITLSDDGEVRRLHHEPIPGTLAALIPEDYWNRTPCDLPIWQLIVKPS